MTEDTWQQLFQQMEKRWKASALVMYRNLRRLGGDGALYGPGDSKSISTSFSITK
ncbi:neutral zinc metallopeptidase family protein [Candidatus Erwinia dacicola]|uniref:Neutral zinc metallopeptidase family protein n=1 Tax=Candidatus Erwinia dacicola TaxID=252393 RepID=A0A328TRS0_9GAMM|nr:neutral zinc metallopeptidase family protein [Candidatus Erwinia dacicola]